MDYMKQLDEDIQFGFQMAIEYAELAVKYDKDPIEAMKTKLAEWDTKRSTLKV